MNVKQISSFASGNVSKLNRSSATDTADTFAKMLDNLKHGRAADYDKEKIDAEGVTTLTQVMSDGSVVVTVRDANGKIISQNKTRAMSPDPNAHVISTKVETKEIAAADLLNLISQSGNF